MTPTDLRRLASGIATFAILAACTAQDDGTSSPLPTVVPTDPASASASAPRSPSATEAASAEPSASATTDATPVAASPEPTASGFPTEFAVEPNRDADALFAVRDSCRNPQDGYELAYPDDWYTNTEIRDVPACSWFSPSFYTVDDADAVPAEIAIEIFWTPGDRGATTDVLASEDGLVGGQYATRIETAGTAADPAQGTSYEYVIQLGPTREEGPNLVARTDTEMGGDYELNKAVLDRIVSTMEFFGSVQ